MEKLHTEKEIAEKTGIPRTSLNKWRSQGKPPIFRRIRGRVYYRLKDVELFIQKESF